MLAGTLSLAAALAAPVDAQILRLPKRTNVPIAWISASAGFLQPNTVNDGTTQSEWDFGSGIQYRASLERGIANQSSIGVAGTYAPSMPLTYYSAATCGSCDAHATISSIGAFFHAGGGLGLFQVLEVTVGLTHYGSFTADEAQASPLPLAGSTRALPPEGGDSDFSFGLGYGFGYGLSARTHIMLVQDATQVLHQSEGLSGNASRSSTHYTTRLGLRIGAGHRKL